MNNLEIESISQASNVCRICLKDANETKHLFSEYEESKEILNKIYLCFQIILSFEKYLPSVICKACLAELEMANSFRLKCVSFEERFTKYCSKLLEHKANIQTNELTTMKTLINDNTYEEINLFCEEDDISNSNNIVYDDNINYNISDKQKVSDLSLFQNKVKFKCSTCEKVLVNEQSLLKHTVTMHENRKHVGKITGFGSTRRYHCTHCPYSTPHSQTLVNHMRRHNGERPYRCECGKSFTQNSSLNAHRKVHSNTTYFTCSVCGKQFKHAYTLKNHLIVHEDGNFVCSICQKVLKSKRSLQFHMDRHYNIRNYSCESCGDTFVASSELLNHRKKHSVEKKIECHLCGYKTHTKKNLIVHLKRHTGDKAFKCELCEVTLYTKGDLHRHRRVHTREKPYTCPTCAQRFTYSSSLNKHMHTLHGTEYKWNDFKWKETRKIRLVKVEINK